jgi:hypothetical protein
MYVIWIQQAKGKNELWLNNKYIFFLEIIKHAMFTNILQTWNLPKLFLVHLPQ